MSAETEKTSLPSNRGKGTSLVTNPRVVRKPDLTFSYGEHPDQVIDVWLPEPSFDMDPGPLVFLWHGGFWRDTFDRAHVAPLAVALAVKGCVVATPEYRRTGAHSEGGWPHTFEDVAAGIDLLPGAVESARPGLYDPERIVYAGHSAGGQIALWAAERHRIPRESPGALDSKPRVSRVVAFAPVADLARAYELGLGEGAVAALIGASPSEAPGRYASVDMGLIGSVSTDTIIIHGAEDDRVPVALSEEYAAHNPITLRIIEDTDHFDLIDPDDIGWRLISHDITSL